MSEFRFTYPEVSRFRQRLEALRTQLVELESKNTHDALNDLSLETTDELSHIRTHAADLGSNESDQERTLELAEIENQEVQDIDDALFKLNNGTFGRCENCDCEIPMARLEALPQTRYCVECEAVRERVQRARMHEVRL